MKELLNRLYEHLVTKEKYNTLLIRFEGKQEEIENKIIEFNTQVNINKIEREKFGQAVEELTQKLVKEKQKYRELKEKIKNESNGNL